MKTLKIFLSETTRPRALIFGMLTSTKFVQIIPLGPKLGPSQGSYILHRLNKTESAVFQYCSFSISKDPVFQIIYIGQTWNKFLVCNHKALSLDIWYVASSSGPLPSCSYNASCAKKWARPRSQMFFIGLFIYGKNERIFPS